MFFSITAGQTFNPANWHSQFKVGLGLDLSSGTEVVLKAQTAKGDPSAAEMQQAISVLESRVNGTGNSGAQVQQQGADLINVSVPGKAANDVINLVSSTAKLAFRPVLLAGAVHRPGGRDAECHPVGHGQRLEPVGHAVGPQPRGHPVDGRLREHECEPEGLGPGLLGQAGEPLRHGDRHRFRHGEHDTEREHDRQGQRHPTASATPTPTSTASSSTAFGNPSAVNAATMKLFNKLVCTPSSDPTR